MLYDPKWNVTSAPITAKDVLIEARNKIARRENWLNRLPEWQEEIAGRFCSARAIWTSRGPTMEAFRILCAVTGAKENDPDHSLPIWNDRHTHAEVLAAFDEAIALCR